MNGPKYVFDSNIFINLQRFYPADIFGGLWSKIETLFDERIIVSSDEVIVEIVKGNDSLIDWVKERPDSFYTSDETIQLIVRDILKNYSALVTSANKSNAADPFVIALAKHLDCTLVSEEKKSGNAQSPKIPNICEALQVRCIRFFEFLREAGIRLV
jgi:hypothetical protein